MVLVCCKSRSHRLQIVFKMKNFKKIFLSETTRPSALIFGMKHHLVVLNQVCSNYAPGTKMAPPGGHMFYIGLYFEKHEKIFLSETIWPRIFIFGM